MANSLSHPCRTCGHSCDLRLVCDDDVSRRDRVFDVTFDDKHCGVFVIFKMRTPCKI